MRKSLLAAVTTTAAVLLTGCTGGVERVDGAAAPVAAPSASVTTTLAGPAPTTTAAAPTTEPTRSASTRATRPTASASRVARPSCPVTEAALRKAVRADPRSGVSPDARFTKIVCFEDYAATTLPERSDSDEAYVVFEYASGSWSVLSKGSADICPGVPADVVRHFREARYGACR